MKINRVEMFGFKSFVNKTSVSFSEGIAAIVGPNGCGKSNIVDAIRWVLGEQSPRQLRGNVMEDVIFAGSESRAPLGVAEVTITLANGNGTAPPPFENMSEIAVTRRLYRSGESEYLINKAPCRLKDIVYLFMDTGVGTRAYSIIDQGQIGGFIEAKPGERRILVEEVAGISKFKFKKDEALRKIEHTRQNLLRLEDILGEIKRQMNSLHRQAKKADRYLELKQKLKGLELFLASTDYAKWQDILTRKEGVITLESEKENALAARIAQLELNAEELELASLEQEKLIEEQRSKAHHLEKLIQDKRNRIEYLNHSLEEIKRHLADTAQGLEREEQHKKEI
ncbi:MAG: AAA family ATPase, partial [Deltaproteobacteria bacterium]|nr:AAA family ATPase [Deltaproteobacteria bacterium]